MPELKPPVQAIPIPPTERPPTAAEERLFTRFQALLDRAERATQSAGLRLQNVYLAVQFAAANGLPQPVAISPADEELYYQLRDSVRRMRSAEQAAIAWTAGIRMTADGRDFDIALFPGHELGGIVIPIAVGLVILAAAVASAIHAIEKAREIQNKFAAAMDVADKNLCADPSSSTCQKWQVEKQQKNWKVNKSLADTIGSGISKLAGGLGIGLAVAIGLIVLSTWSRSSR